MPYTLIKNLTTVNFTKGNKGRKYIVIHYTGNKTDTTTENANTATSNANSAASAANDAADRANEIYSIIIQSRRCY